MCPSSDYSAIWKSINKGLSWTEVHDPNDYWYVVGMWIDYPNGLLYIHKRSTGGGVIYHQFWKYELDNNDTATRLGPDYAYGIILSMYWDEEGGDIFLIGTDIYAHNRSLYGFSVYKYNSGSNTWAQEDIYSWGSSYVGDYALSKTVVVGTKSYAISDDPSTQPSKVRIMEFNSSTSTISSLWDSNAYTILQSNQKTIAYDENDIIYFILNKNSDGKNYLCSFSISGTTFTELGVYNLSLMLNRNTISTANPPNNLEKAFHASEDKIYQIPSNYNGRLNLISTFNFSDNIAAITDHFVIDYSGNIYEYVNVLDSIFEGIIYHSRNDYPTFKMKFNSDNIQISPQQFLQIIGSYTANGSTTSNQIVLEGIAEAPTEGRIQFVLVKNQSFEMDETKPKGSKAGRSDQIISDINDDGAPHGPEYIRDGTLAVGSAMGTLEFNNTKTYRKVVNDFAEKDGFLFNLRPQGDLDYNNGSIDSGADIRQDGTTYTDVILQVKAWKVAKLNQIIVNGAINLATGEPYSGIWNDTEDQQEVGINSATIEDAMLNSDALCQTKADEMGAIETERLRARFKFRKTTYGLIQPGQTITFKYYVPNYITIPEAQYILDKMILNIKTGVGYGEISSGL